MKHYYTNDELKRKTYYDLYKICVDERLVEGFKENLNREELTQIILKYRSREKVYSIDTYKELGVEGLQELFDSKLGFKLSTANEIKVPHQIVIYKNMPLTIEDDYKISIPEHLSNNNVFLINGKSYICGIFQLEPCLEGRNTYFLKGTKEFFRLNSLTNQNYSLIFFNRTDEKFLFESYYKNNLGILLPSSMNYYHVPLDNFLYIDMEKTDTTLCIDFGTANTTAGVYLDRYYVKNLPQHKILNGTLNLDKINYVKFPKGKEEQSNVIPTVVYVRNCFNENNIEFKFGYEVAELLKNNNYSLKGSVFYGIKNWVRTLNENERVVDENGDVRYIPRKIIIKAYIDYIVYRAEALFKCKFKKIHITTPVKLKVEFLRMFQEILPDYTIIADNALDEGVAVLYNSIEKIMVNGKFKQNTQYKALIIDCGGGTTDLASCLFKIKSEDIYYDVDIKTTFENSEESFGGNNVTYRIMQYLKIILAQYYTNKKELNINNLIPFANDLIYREVDDKGLKVIYENLDLEYEKSENIIPTKFRDFENKASDEYGKVKNNFFFLWECAELLKKELFKRTSIVRTRFDNLYHSSEDLSITYINNWILYILERGEFKTHTSFPNLIITKAEVLKLVKADIYEIFRRFLTQYYESNKLFEYSLIKLSGQSCKVNLFNEILKEFVPGKMIDFRRNVEENEEQLKISCLDGALRYLNSSKMGSIRVSIKNDIPIVPYSLCGTKYTGEEVELIRIGGQAGKNCGFIKKISTIEILPLYLKNKEQELKKNYTYINKPYDYRELDEVEIIKELNGHFAQEALDDIYNGESKFFIFTDSNFWGFYIVGVKRQEGQLYIGKTEYFSFEEDITTISFFDGKH